MNYVLITGVSSGIGFDATRYLIERGYSVFGSVRKREDSDRLRNQFGEAFIPLIFDVTDQEAILAASEHVNNFLGTKNLSALINNAGFSAPGPLNLISDDTFRNQIDVNLHGVRYVTNAFLPVLGTVNRESPGKIINISSISGLFSSPFNGSYCISKHALESMCDVYRRELMYYGIDVISIQPGPIKTEIWKKNIGSLQPYENSDYGNFLKRADKVIEHAEKKALDVEVVSKLIHKVIEKKRPKTRYIVHKNGILFKLVAKFAPDRLVDKMIWKNLNASDETKYRPV